MRLPPEEADSITMMPTDTPATRRLRLGKVCRSGLRPKGYSEATPTLFDDPLVQGEVFGVDDADPAPQKGEGLALSVEGAFVGGGVDSASHPAYDAKSDFGKLFERVHGRTASRNGWGFWYRRLRGRALRAICPRGTARWAGHKFRLGGADTNQSPKR